MKMRKKLLFLFACLPLVGNAFTGMVEIDGIYYNVITKAKTAEVTTISQHHYGEIGYYSGDIVIPPTVEYEGIICNVTSIQRESFLDCKNLNSIKLPNSLLSIGVGAFRGCDKLTELEIPNSVTLIEGLAFKDCTNLASITLSSNLTSLGYMAFANCTNLSSVVIPNLVTIIESELFSNCTNIKSISWGGNVVQIDSRAFIDCCSLCEISSLKNVSYIGLEAFKGCSSLPLIEIGNSIKNIYDGTFQGCSSIKAFSLPDGISSIGKNSFNGCNNLTTVYLPKSITTIGEYAFENCPEISDVYCNAINPPKAETFTFLSSYPEYATLHVPENSIQLYKDKSPWSGFGSIIALAEDIQCGTPTITYSKGKLLFSSTTEDVEFISEIKDTDVKSYHSNEVSISATYYVEVYAKKTGYNNSEIASATLCWIDVEPRTEGITESMSEVRAYPVLIQNNDGNIQVFGIPDGTEIKVFNLVGIFVGSGTSNDKSATIRTSLKKNETAILKIGEKSIKTILH